MNKKIISILTFLCCAFTLHAQSLDMPTDPNVRIGKLDNGLTYYIRHNELPAKQADFYIAQKVGSILEEDDQRGLAHFLEHMCFNGTTHFPGNALREYLQDIGVKFGENLNAYTSVDETVYNISNVPMLREGITDSCLLILHDWSHDLTLNDKDIDEERGVIHEEWRSRNSAMSRMYEQTFPEMLSNSRYAYRLPIGLMSVVDKFPYKALRDYYKKWYRPDQQAVIVVGDVDVDKIESKIKALFGNIKMPANAAKREYYTVPNNKEPIVTFAKDKEQANIMTYIFFKHEVTPESQKKLITYPMTSYVKSMMADMINIRLAEKMIEGNPPYLVAQVQDGIFMTSKTKGSFTGVVACKDNKVSEAFAALLTEIERARRFGFTESEYDRCRTDYLSGLDRSYMERDKRKNSTFVNECVRNFIDGEPITDIENDYKLMKRLAPSIPVAMMNKEIQKLVTDTNVVISVFGSDKEGLTYPDKAKMLALLDSVRHADIKPYVDKTSDKPLMSDKPKGGKIVKQNNNGPFGTTVLTLSNGINVVIMPTKYKANQIIMNGFAMGGTSLFDNNLVPNILTMGKVVSLGGSGDHSVIDLSKLMAGKTASVEADVSTYSQNISGSCVPKDFETMMQMLYLKVTAPRKDTAAYSSFLSRLKLTLKNRAINPMTEFNDSVRAILYQNNPRSAVMTIDKVKELDYDKMLSMYKERFANMGGFTIFLVGNVDIDSVKPLIAQYIGALPSTGKKENFRDNHTELLKGIYASTFSKTMETPKGTVMTVYHGGVDFKLKNLILMRVFEQVLKMYYTDEIREKNGGTYGVSVSGNISYYPKPMYMVNIMFNTDPDKCASLSKDVISVYESVAKTGPKSEYLSRVKEFLLKKFTENQKENSYWLGVLNSYYSYGYDGNTDYADIVNKISADDIQKFAKTLLKSGNRTTIIMKGKK